MGLENFMQTQQNTNPLDVLLKLFEKENITMKTEITQEQFRVLILLKWHQELKAHPEEEGMDILMNRVVPYLMELMVSKNRMSRKEADHILSTIGGFLLESEQTKLKETTS